MPKGAVLNLQGCKPMNYIGSIGTAAVGGCYDALRLSTLKDTT